MFVRFGKFFPAGLLPGLEMGLDIFKILSPACAGKGFVKMKNRTVLFHRLWVVLNEWNYGKEGKGPGRARSVLQEMEWKGY